MKKANRFLTTVMFIFMYLPMAVLIVASFNTGKDITDFEGFTLQQYVRLFQDDDLLALLGNSLLVSVLASFFATVLGTFSAVGIQSLGPRMKRAAMTLTNIPMTNPEIVTGISLALLFTFVGSGLLGQKETLNFGTLLIAHITFNLPYVILNVMPRLKQMDNSLTDAAMDLGCTPLQAFFKVTLPEITPGIVAGAIMAFTMSLDDFVISYFVTGMDFVTLPVKIYSETKKPIQPKIYAMFTLLFGLIFVLMLAMNLIQLNSSKKKNTDRVKADTPARRRLKRITALVAAACLILCMFFLVGKARDQKITLNVYNWGQNIADGSDDTLDIIAAFEEQYPNIKVNYSTYEANEDLYTKLNNGGITVDVIVPSDYMIARMIREGMLLELDYENIPNYELVDDAFKNTAYDPENKYSVPYTWGTVGILYNSKYVDEADVTGWEVLWNEKYKDKILMMGNSRDAFGITQFLLGYDINTTDKAQLDACAEKLKEQRPVLQQYAMDQMYDLMENEVAWIAPYYAGDCMVMMQNNEDLRFYLPEEQGFNLFIDAMCIPACCQEKEAAELFINFMTTPEISGANMDYICYGSPVSAARDFMDPELAASQVVYPDAETQAKGTSFLALPDEITRYMESLFMQVRNQN